jgi:hypothetical protein
LLRFDEKNRLKFVSLTNKFASLRTFSTIVRRSATAIITAIKGNWVSRARLSAMAASSKLVGFCG